MEFQMEFQIIQIVMVFCSIGLIILEKRYNRSKKRTRCNYLEEIILTKTQHEVELNNELYFAKLKIEYLIDQNALHVNKEHEYMQQHLQCCYAKKSEIQDNALKENEEYNNNNKNPESPYNDLSLYSTYR
jgi:hypothetical protein